MLCKWLISQLILCFHCFSVHHTPVTLSAATPAYFRGFTLIALKEGKEGDKEEDHAGSFQVRELSQSYTPWSLPYWLGLVQSKILNAQHYADHI